MFDQILGVLLAEVIGPSGPVETTVETPMPHRTRMNFTPPEAGEYSIKFTWNNLHLPNSPFVGVTSVSNPNDDNPLTLQNKSRASSVSSSGSGGDHKVVLTGKGLAKAIIGAEAEFTIDGSRAGPGILQKDFIKFFLYIVLHLAIYLFLKAFRK